MWHDVPVRSANDTCHTKVKIFRELPIAAPPLGLFQLLLDTRCLRLKTVDFFLHENVEFLHDLRRTFDALREEVVVIKILAHVDSLFVFKAFALRSRIIP